MEILFELEPVYKRDKLLERVKSLEDLVDYIDIPDSPMGITRFFSPIISCIAKNTTKNLKVIAHLRVMDVNRLALESIIKGLELCNVEGIVFIRGDVIEGSTVVGYVKPGEAVELVKSKNKMLAGLTLSLRKPLEDIIARLKSNADFYLVLNLNKNSIEKMKALKKEAGMLGARLYPYIILLTENNRDKLLGLMERWKLHGMEEALELVEASNDISDGVLVSSPSDFKGGLKFVERLRRR